MDRRSSAEPLFPDYPSNARSFIALDSKLLPYWHLIFDLCPELLKLDPPEGLNLFRRYMTWAYRFQPPQDWTFHISLCRWLQSSPFADQLRAEHIESLLSASAARWASDDRSLAHGILITCSSVSVTTVEWKGQRSHLAPATQELPPARFDFAWSPLSRGGVKGFQRWLRVPV